MLFACYVGLGTIRTNDFDDDDDNDNDNDFDNLLISTPGVRYRYFLELHICPVYGAYIVYIVYGFIKITAWKVRAYDVYSRAF